MNNEQFITDGHQNLISLPKPPNRGKMIKITTIDGGLMNNAKHAFNLGCIDAEARHEQQPPAWVKCDPYLMLQYAKGWCTTNYHMQLEKAGNL